MWRLKQWLEGVRNEKLCAAGDHDLEVNEWHGYVLCRRQYRFGRGWCSYFRDDDSVKLSDEEKERRIALEDARWEEARRVCSIVGHIWEMCYPDPWSLCKRCRKVTG